MKKNFIALCILAGLFTISCDKKESKNKRQNKDSVTIIQPQKTESIMVKKTDSVAIEKYDENKLTKNIEVKGLIEGKYSAKSCDNGRFFIEISNVDNQPVFKIFDKNKIIASGNASVEGQGVDEGATITMGEIGGLYEGDKIVIQNYGNAMNEFEHFTQCGEKYLEFIKQ